MKLFFISIFLLVTVSCSVANKSKDNTNVTNVYLRDNFTIGSNISSANQNIPIDGFENVTDRMVLLVDDSLRNIATGVAISPNRVLSVSHFIEDESACLIIAHGKKYKILDIVPFAHCDLSLISIEENMDEISSTSLEFSPLETYKNTYVAYFGIQNITIERANIDKVLDIHDAGYFYKDGILTLGTNVPGMSGCLLFQKEKDKIDFVAISSSTGWQNLQPVSLYVNIFKTMQHFQLQITGE